MCFDIVRIYSNVLCLFVIKDFKIPSNTTLKTPLVAVFEDLDIEIEEEDELKARGKAPLSAFLCGLRLFPEV